MKKINKKAKIIIAVSSGIVTALSLAIIVPFAIFGINTARINTKYDYLKDNSDYSKKVEIEGLNLVKQHISCGYATIEMMSDFYGNKVTEDDLDAKNNGAVSTSSTNGFLKEINASIPTQKFIKKTYLNNDALLKIIHTSLSNNNPVAIEWAALDDDNNWTLHFSLVSTLDITNDAVSVYNPYGKIENITINEFISRTSFKAFKNMPLLYSFGFAYGAFDKNTIFYAQ